MKLFRFANRPNANANQIPQVRVQTVHLIGPGTLRQRSEHLLFESEKSKQIRVDIEGLHDVLAYGDVRPTSDALLLMQNHGVGFSMLSPNGSNLRAHLTFETSQRALQRLIQFQSFNDARWQLLYAREVVCGKLQSTGNALRHYQRQGKTLERGILQKMERAVESASQADSVQQLRGIEGQGAALWYQQYGALLRPRWKFVTRNRRPPPAPCSATWQTAAQIALAVLVAGSIAAALAADELGGQRAGASDIAGTIDQCATVAKDSDHGALVEREPDKKTALLDLAQPRPAVCQSLQIQRLG